jgi:alkanesulfonate monooxygenase SsuD/methylene tetrahydromethanopterin reductase-like flavin-dependent oxidoreductase (luciferase family)
MCRFEGKHFRFENVTIHPRPVQTPHPPIVVGAQMPRTVERAARLGDGWATDSKVTVGELEPLVRLFREVVAADPDPRPRTINVGRDVGIGRSREEVERIWLPSIQKAWIRYWEMGMRFPDERDVHARLARGEQVGLEEFAEDRFLAGSPDDCIAGVERIRSATDCTSILVRLGYEQTFNEKGMRLFAQEVIPAFRPS